MAWNRLKYWPHMLLKTWIQLEYPSFGSKEKVLKNNNMCSQPPRWLSAHTSHCKDYIVQYRMSQISKLSHSSPVDALAMFTDCIV